jgi:FAD/FMN-containing dehydrogenase
MRKERKKMLKIETSPGRTTPFDSRWVQALKNQMPGVVLLPEDEGYHRASLPWNLTYEQHPALVVMVGSATDILSAVRFARRHGLPVAVQGGGHGYSHPADGALLINTKKMNAVHVDAQTQSIRVEAGATWGTVIHEAHAFGLAPLNGTSPTVGVVGYTLGGGHGWLARQYGLAAGSCRSLELVTADGQMLHVDNTSHPDLFWGLRGGGGNLGVITSMELQLYPVRKVFAGRISYPIERAREVLALYTEWVRTVPDELTSLLNIQHLSPDHPEASSINVMACYNGILEEGERLIGLFRVLGEPLIDTFGEMLYSQIGTVHGDPTDPTVLPDGFIYTRSVSLTGLSSTSIDALLAFGSNASSGFGIIELRHLGGALTRIPVDAMAYSHQDAVFTLITMALANTREDFAPLDERVSALREDLRRDLTGKGLFNFLGHDELSSEHTRAAFSAAHYERLVALKKTYDPDNVFRFHHGVLPVGESW